MSEVTNGAPATGGADGTVLSAPAAPAPAAPPAADPALISMPSDAFKARLEETASKAQAKLLKKFGLENEAALEAQLAAAKKLADEKLSADERRDKRIKELEQYETKAKELEARVQARVDREFAALSAEHQALVEKMSRGDKAQYEHVIETLRESGMFSAPSEPLQPAPKTVAPTPAPKPSGTQTKFQEYEALVQRHPTIGALFYQNNQHEIEATRPASG